MSKELAVRTLPTIDDVRLLAIKRRLFEGSILIIDWQIKYFTTKEKALDYAVSLIMAGYRVEVNGEPV